MGLAGATPLVFALVAGNRESLGAMTTKTNEQRVIDLVTATLRPLGYYAAVGSTSVSQEDFLLFWEKDLSSTDPDVPGLTVQLNRELVEDELLGEYWQPGD
jgi:hypothetical protein